MLRALGFAARYGRWCLILGLLAGLLMPDWTLIVRPFLPVLIAVLLFLAALRIGPSAAVGGLGEVRRTVALVVVFQCLAPLLALAMLWMFGVAASPFALALLLVLAAPPVTGSPNFTILMGQAPAAAMRLLLIGTAALPLTMIPVLSFAPELGSVSDVVRAALRLMAVIVGAVGLAFALRGLAFQTLSDPARDALDGASAITLGVVVVGLMSAVGPALTNTPFYFGIWLLFAFVVNFGLQITAFLSVPVPAADRTATSIVAGNRNIALFLVALPAETMEEVLLFIGCYQIPMYLTPVLLKRVLSPGRA